MLANAARSPFLHGRVGERGRGAIALRTRYGQVSFHLRHAPRGASMPELPPQAPAPRKLIGLVAHDNKKRDLIEWAEYNAPLLLRHDLVATGTTGRLLEEALGVPVRQLRSGPLGGDQQLGAMIADGDIDFLVFFWDPLEPQPHDPDVKALLRIAIVWNIPVACDRASADFMISSPLMESSYERTNPDYGTYIGRSIDTGPGAAQP
jgi:methylglyoxal synthase